MISIIDKFENYNIDFPLDTAIKGCYRSLDRYYSIIRKRFYIVFFHEPAS